MEAPKAVNIARSGNQRRHNMAANDLSKFSDRDIQIIEFAALGVTDVTISENLGLAKTTIATYWKRLFKKTNCATRTQVVARYLILKAQQEHELLSSQLMALTLYCNRLESKSLDASSDALPNLVKSVEDLRDWLKSPQHHVVGLSTVALDVHESQFARERLEVIFASAQILTERIESLFEGLDEAVLSRSA